MATASDSGKGDPPDPPNAHINTDALPSDSSPVHSAKNDSIPTDIDQDLLNNRHSDQDQDQSDDDMEFYDTDIDNALDFTIPAPQKDTKVTGYDILMTHSPPVDSSHDANSMNIDDLGTATTDIDLLVDDTDTDFETPPAKTNNDTVGIDSATKTIPYRLRYATNSE